jgi:predicted lipoprotein with Yx(FWY)xxD motif
MADRIRRPGDVQEGSVMRMHRRTAFAALALAGLGGATFGAEQYLSGPDAAVFVERAAVIATTPPSPAPASSGQAGQAGQDEAPAEVAPVPEPTVAKTQKWVKIYSGASSKNINPPKSTTGGSHNVELNATPSDQIGTFVTDGAGRTLYRFDDDSAQPPKATCNGDCAKTWPPLLIKSPGKIFPKGIDPKILGYVERADGHCQVTINGWPIYYFSGDTKAGDFRGQGLKGKWFAVTPSGGKTHFLLDAPDTDQTPS